MIKKEQKTSRQEFVCNLMTRGFYIHLILIVGSSSCWYACCRFGIYSMNTWCNIHLLFKLFFDEAFQHTPNKRFCYSSKKTKDSVTLQHVRMTDKDARVPHTPLINTVLFNRDWVLAWQRQTRLPLGLLLSNESFDFRQYCWIILSVN